MKKESQTIFENSSIEFVTVAAEYCVFIENARDYTTASFVDKTLKILPLLYLKALLLPKFDRINDDQLEVCVTETQYEQIRQSIAKVMADKDDYLDVFVEDMVYSDQPIGKNISEDLADIYQDIRDFIYVFQLGLNETMNDSLCVCQENFEAYWGQKLVNTLRALHEVKYNQKSNEDDINGELDENEMDIDDSDSFDFE